MTSSTTLKVGGHTFIELDASKPVPSTITRSNGVIILQDRNNGRYTVNTSNKLGTQLTKVIRGIGLNKAINKVYGDSAAKHLRFFYLELGQLAFGSDRGFELVPVDAVAVYPAKDRFQLCLLGDLFEDAVNATVLAKAELYLKREQKLGRGGKFSYYLDYVPDLKERMERTRKQLHQGEVK